MMARPRKQTLEFSREKMEAIANSWCEDLPIKPETTREYQLFYMGLKYGQLQTRKAVARAVCDDSIIDFDRDLKNLGIAQ